MDAFFNLFLSLYETTGINLTIFYDAYDRERFVEGIYSTIWLSLSCLFFSLIIGLVGAWLQGSKFTFTKRIVQIYIQLFRNTPPLVQMYFFFFGVGALLPAVEGEFGIPEPMISAFSWAVISLAFFAGAFNVEIFRSGIEAVPESTIEAAEALGYSRTKAYIYIVLPLAFRVCLPSLTNNMVNLVKTTTLAYAIAVPELLYVSNQIWSDNSNVPEMMIVLLFVYFMLVGLLVWGMSSWEKKLKLPGYGV
jgi:polar amino acid transport system permease protein